MVNPNNAKTAVGYIRVSTANQAENGISLENQKKRIKDYCDYKGLTLLETIEDAGVSGGINKGRDGFISLLDRIEANNFDILILYSLERLSRDMLSLLVIEKFLAENDTELHTVEGQIDTSSPEGFLSFGMKAFLSEMERRQISHRTVKAMEHKKSQGMVIGTTPYGFKRDGNKLIEEKEEQKVISLANKLYSNGARLKDIVSALNEKGFKNRNGNEWAAAQVRNFINGYAGSFKKSKKKTTAILRTFLESI